MQEKATPEWMVNKRIESGLSAEVQLYNLADDPGEMVNLASRHPEKVRKLQALLEQIRRELTKK